MKFYDYLIKNKELELQKIRENPKEYYHSHLIRTNVENVCFFVFLSLIFISFYVVMCILSLNGVITL